MNLRSGIRLADYRDGDTWYWMIRAFNLQVGDTFIWRGAMFIVKRIVNEKYKCVSASINTQGVKIELGINSQERVELIIEL